MAMLRPFATSNAKYERAGRSGDHGSRARPEEPRAVPELRIVQLIPPRGQANGDVPVGEGRRAPGRGPSPAWPSAPSSGTRSVLRLTGVVDLRRPRLSTAVTRSRWLPGRTSPGSRSCVYGATVSEPSGTPSRRNVTATTRPERALAAAFSVVGPATVPGGARSSTAGGSLAEEERKELVGRE